MGKTNKPQSKFRKITKKSVQDDYEHNVWRAVEDMWVEMYAGFGMPTEVINEKIESLVYAYCRFLSEDTQKDLHKMSAHKRRKLR